MWAFYRQTLTAGMGMEVMVLVFIVIIIGGLGSVGGCFVGSILVALVANYVGFVEPKLALISNILVMALVLIWRAARSCAARLAPRASTATWPIAWERAWSVRAV